MQTRSSSAPWLESPLSLLPKPDETMPQPAPPASPLLRLPRELRTAIFTTCLCTPLGLTFPSPSQARGLSPQLLRVSRQLHAECAPLLYGGTRPIFSHPSDANVFRHGVADGRSVAAHVRAVVLRVKNADARLWTAYFNSLAPERSLVRDFPALRTVYVRFRGMRWSGVMPAAGNVLAWLREPRLVEVVPALRKCVADVRVELCVRVPEDWDAGIWEKVVQMLLREDPGEDGPVLKRDGGYVALMGVWFKLETEGT